MILPLARPSFPENPQWQTWTDSSASGSFIRKKDRPEAVTQLSPARLYASSPSRVKPIREQKLVKANGSGFMAAIPSLGNARRFDRNLGGNRRGGFILPNDRVDVLLSRREKVQTGDGAAGEVITSQVLLANLRVLAIDQAPKEKEGQNAVLGKTATLEMSPQDVEILAKARISGTLAAERGAALPTAR